MKTIFSDKMVDSLARAPAIVEQSFYKQLQFLGADLRHPSLRAKKYDETRNIWQARVTRDWRFYFRIENDTYHLLDIIRHPK